MEKIKQLLLNDVDMLKEVVRELNSWNGSLEHLDIQENDEEFFNVYFQGNPMEAVRASFYGDYRYMDEFVKFNGYGNLESMSEYDFEEVLKSEVDDIIELLITEQHNLSLDGELEELLNGEDDEENDEDED